MTPEEVFNDATDLCNCVLGNVRTKEQFRKVVLRLVLNSIVASEYDSDFKQGIKDLLMWKA
jgi:hypothetical protein